MASLTVLRSLVYVYLGTRETDPAYPTATVDALLNAAANRLITDVQQANPAWLRKVTTLAASPAGSRTYTLPADFAGYLEVRLTDSEGVLLTEVGDDQLNMSWNAPVFSITGADASATLTTDNQTAAGTPLYFKHRYQPAELVNPADTPAWCPAPFHDVIARLAAVDAFGLGNEARPAPEFLQVTDDRIAQFWAHVTRRGVQPLRTREVL